MSAQALSAPARGESGKPLGVVVKILAFVLALTCLVQASTTFLVVASHYEKTKSQFDERLDSFLQARADLLGGLVWRLQYDELDRVLNAMLREESAASIAVYDETGAAVARVERPLRSEAPKILAMTELRHMNGLVNDKAGHVEIIASLEGVYAELEDQRRSAIALMLASACAIVAAVWLALDRLIGRPLGELRCAIARSQAGEQGVRLTGRAADEVGELFDAFNGFMEANERSIATIKSANDRLRELAERDELTNLFNRRAAQAHFEKLRGAADVAVAFMDIDLFKSANDLLGHKGGDDLLREVAGRLLREIEGEAQAYRLGGDEFLVIWRGAGSSERAFNYAERLRRAVSGRYHLGTLTHEATVSVGVYHASQASGDLDAVLSMSDLALREAKHSGRGRTTLLNSQLLQAAEERLEIERSVAQALAEGHFEMFFQPQFDLRERRIVGAEALARWRRPEGGMISPGLFMPIIEDMGLSLEHGKLAIRQCCSAAERLRTELGRSIPVSLNANAQQLAQAEFWTTLLLELERRRLPASAIEVEVTESQLIGNLEAASRALAEFRALGGGVALDDFGTGYSSLAYLTQLPIDKVKIDRSFVRRAPTDRTVATILSVSTQLAAAIGAEVVAEGVETEAEEEAVALQGIRYVQGFRYGKPMELDALLAGLRGGMGGMDAEGRKSA